MGVTVIVAAGDNGASDGATNGALTVDFPASSPYVISCGGTKLALTGNSILSEQVWNELAQSRKVPPAAVSAKCLRPHLFQESAPECSPLLPMVFEAAGTGCRGRRRSSQRIQRAGGRRIHGNWRNQRCSASLGRIARAHQSAGRQTGGIFESNPVLGECSYHISRHNFRQQQRLFGGSGMGPVHGAWNARWHAPVCGSEKQLRRRKD